MSNEDIFTAIEKLGYEIRDSEPFCSFKIVINNCAKTEIYFHRIEVKQ